MQKNEFTQKCSDLADMEPRVVPIVQHYEWIYDFAHGADVEIFRVTYALSIVCAWLYRVRRPKFHCQKMTTFEAVIAAAWCRANLLSAKPVTAVELAAWLGQSYDAVIKKIASGMLHGTPSEINALSALGECERLGKMP